MAEYIIIDTDLEIGFIVVDAGGVSSILGITRDKVQNLFRNNVKLVNLKQFAILKSPYHVSSRRGGDMRAKRKK